MSFIAYSKIAVPEKAKPVNYSKITVPQSSSEVDYDEESSLSGRFSEGIISAGKKVLTSVWTWALVVVVFAGVKIHASHSQEDNDPEPSTNYWIESSKLEFDWDNDVEFKFHHPTRK